MNSVIEKTNGPKISSSQQAENVDGNKKVSLVRSKGAILIDVIQKFKEIDFRKNNRIFVNAQGQIFKDINDVPLGEQGLTPKDSKEMFSEAIAKAGLSERTDLADLSRLLNSFLDGKSPIELKIDSLIEDFKKRSGVGKRLHLSEEEKELVFEYWNECKANMTKKEFSAKLGLSYPACVNLIKSYDLIKE
ncbi:hypothetical protein [Cyclobacterium plantarum]|uniref:Uncharacterized protein n=1 Tax=Cyclobacterium plantarum TaxID=2716263 RepID=A0ABX0HC14_9BACT|nr:hypothetical protein [Cyclobacterium plantarum]NHE57971.1 hypothetical protein [Cyclobacterium plantarum]